MCTFYQCPNVPPCKRIFIFKVFCLKESLLFIKSSIYLVIIITQKLLKTTTSRELNKAKVLYIFHVNFTILSVLMPIITHFLQMFSNQEES